MKKFLAVIALSAALPALAQTSFLGIPLEATFPGDMKECPKHQALNMTDPTLIKTAGICYFRKSPSSYEVYNGPDVGIGHVLTLETFEDKPLIFKLTFGKAKYSQAVDIFSARYGKPQKTSHEEVRNAVGQSFDAKTSIWEGGSLRIQLDEIGADIRWGAAEVVNVPVMSRMLSEGKATAKAAASKL
jgi:hypothetical protein